MGAKGWGAGAFALAFADGERVPWNPAAGLPGKKGDGGVVGAGEVRDFCAVIPNAGIGMGDNVEGFVLVVYPCGGLVEYVAGEVVSGAATDAIEGVIKSAQCRVNGAGELAVGVGVSPSVACGGAFQSAVFGIEGVLWALCIKEIGEGGGTRNVVGGGVGSSGGFDGFLEGGCAGVGG